MADGASKSRGSRDRLKARRKTLGHSQESLAEELQVHRKTVGRWETGLSTPHPWQRPKLAQVLQVSIDELAYLLTVGPSPTQNTPADTVEYSIDFPEGEAVQRREFLALAGTTLAGTVVSPAAVLQDLALTLIESRQSPSLGVDLSLPTLQSGVARMKQAYQACRYEVVADKLPALLECLQTAGSLTAGDDRRTVAGLSAQAFHVAASVLLKVDGHALASVAADRSVDAARRSEDPVVAAASARILTHTLMTSGQHAEAAVLASSAAAELERAIEVPTPDSLSVYGALLLRGAIAASQDEDASTARGLLDESEQAAIRLGDGANHHWTAFGPDNVLAHRASVEVTLGNAGSAIEHVRAIDFDSFELPERKVTVLIDAAHAYSQWGKYDQAVSALQAASDVANLELRVRAPVRQLVGHLRSAAPSSVQSDLDLLVDRVGLAA